MLNTRQNLLNEFKTYLEDRDLTNEKMNAYFNDDRLRDFILNKVENMKYSSSKTVISNMSGIIISLKETNVSMNVSTDLFTKIKDEVKEMKYEFQSNKDIHKSFSNVGGVISGLYEKDFKYGVLSEVLYSCGFRIDEGMQLLSNPYKHIQDNKVIEISGKSGKIYQSKEISNELRQKIFMLHNQGFKINTKTFYNAINKIEKGSAHSFRYSYIKDKYNQLTVENKLSHKEVMNIISLEVNHFRNTTPYYLNRM